jgi:predicted NUDIX family NTP pyrophosphohydrolase
MRVVSTMSGEISAGLLVYRQTSDGLEFLLVHPGGPFWKNKDEAAWSIPKGLVDPGEDRWAAALREFAEETGQSIAASGVELTACRTPGGKIIHAWLVEADLDVTAFHSNSFEMEWPPKSGRRVEFPEVDRAAYFGAKDALTKIHKGQRPIMLEALERLDQIGAAGSR